ncbi:hypothetical protein COU91_01725 [Candidatus Saccharibacteria bacterium CG10_big_fil_rev_8_21_14_0_10_47_8]|nr:MAG: hypothetical protein COU91_01725 [Candidatus Saccharibacteria bacterium CG10_big_fil_rev_8_21_14_0_10_47_8]
MLSPIDSQRIQLSLQIITELDCHPYTGKATYKATHDASEREKSSPKPGWYIRTNRTEDKNR